MTPLLLAQVPLAARESLTGWYVGLIIGFTIVAVVVVLVAIILTYAARIADQAKEGIGSMDSARSTTLPVWELQHVNVAITGIWKAAESGREILTERLGQSR